MLGSVLRRARGSYVEVRTDSDPVELLVQDRPVSPLLEPDPEAITTHRQPFLHDGDEEDLGLLSPSMEGDLLQNDQDKNQHPPSCLSLELSGAYCQKTAEAPPAILWKGPARSSLIGEALIFALSICFLILGACVMSLENTPQNAWSRRVVQAIRIAPSLWPIIFSGVLGNSVKVWAHLRLERGVSLMSLEQLLGSLTMASCVITIFRWSLFRRSSAVLLLLWAFNPIGSQAIFRGVSLQSRHGTSQGYVEYYNTSLSSQIQLSAFKESPHRVTRPLTRTLYLSLLSDYIASIQYVNSTNKETRKVVTLLGGDYSAGSQAAMDPWGNLRIPIIDHIPDYNLSDPHRWLEIPWNGRVLNYSSLLGDRVHGVNRSLIGNSSFSISSSYQKLKCEKWTMLDNPEQYGNNGSFVSNSSKADIWFMKNTGKNLRDHKISLSYGKSFASKLYITPGISRSMGGNEKNTSELVFAIPGLNRLEIPATKCSGETIYVDVNVTCISKGSLGKAVCGVNALRETLHPPTNPNRTVLDDYYRSNQTCYYLMDILNDEERFQYSTTMTSSLMERYLMNPLTAFENLDYLVDVSKLDVEIFERRFSLLWNTLWKISYMDRDAITGKVFISRNHPIQLSDILLRSTSQEIYSLPDVYVVDKVWIAIYFLSVSVMCFAAVFSFVVRSQCHAPVILGFTSSLMRDSKYFQGRSLFKNSGEESAGMSERLGKLKVMVADVREGKGEAGRIAFVPADLGRMVEKGQRYR